MKKSGLVLYVLISVFFAFLTINNKALFFHPTSLYTDSIPQISLLGSKELLTKIFTSDLSLYTHGEYRPIPFLVLSCIKILLKKHFGPPAVHIFLIFMHLLCTFIFFFISLKLLSELPAFLLSLMFLVHPLLIIPVNDPNQVCVSMGILFCLLSIFYYLVYLEERRKSAFFLSLFFFVTALFCSKLAIFVPIFIAIFCHIGLKHKKVALGICIYFVLLFILLSVCGINSVFLFAGALLFTLIFVLNTMEDKKELFSVLLNLSLFMGFIFIWYWISNYVGVKPVFKYPLAKMDSSSILRPFYLLFIWKSIFGKNMLYVFLLIPLFIVPLLLGNELWQNIIISGFVLFFMTFSVGLCKVYESDVKYWEAVNKSMDEPVSMVNLAHAYISENMYEKAENILYGLKFERGHLPDLLRDTINVELGLLYHKMGKEKISAYYFLQKPSGALPGASKIAKWRLIPIGDFFFDLGYLSYAENYYASALVLDPYDVDIYKKLGKILVYKNFLRASLRYFDKVLKRNPKDKEAILYACFVSKMIRDKDRYSYYKSMWKKETKTEPDFKPIYAKFNHYNRDRLRKMLSGDPVVLFYTGETDKRFVYKLNNKKYVFWEVPLEIGKYFYRRGNYDAAIAFLGYAYDISGGRKEVKEYLSMAQEKKAIPTQEEIIRAIKEQEEVERIMRKKGIKNPWELMEKR